MRNLPEVFDKNFFTRFSNLRKDFFKAIHFVMVLLMVNSISPNENINFTNYFMKFKTSLIRICQKITEHAATRLSTEHRTMESNRCFIR